jgi:hypothetical protein
VAAGGVDGGGVVVVCAIADDDIRSAAQAARTEAFIDLLLESL